jgi:hypothetical protein
VLLYIKNKKELDIGESNKTHPFDSPTIATRTVYNIVEPDANTCDNLKITTRKYISNKTSSKFLGFGKDVWSDWRISSSDLDTKTTEINYQQFLQNTGVDKIPPSKEEMDKLETEMSNADKMGGGAKKPHKTAEKEMLGGRNRVVYKDGNRKFVQIKGEYVPIKAARKILA